MGRIVNVFRSLTLTSCRCRMVLSSDTSPHPHRPLVLCLISLHLKSPVSSHTHYCVA
ncbi:hypothetical protein THIOM_000075 [Candidatus Thiomargarita nelsonii]|uniref:Uncharacterized protein n=1 Tax=Candidatus Thiomargarita nelsonii TaxID=1003181 RepID=A0A176S7V9_9GAMM|nr:hypothetical protein THIOM_000075 [Candidatus Thiomargarita nelsonii]